MGGGEQPPASRGHCGRPRSAELRRSPLEAVQEGLGAVDVADADHRFDRVARVPQHTRLVQPDFEDTLHQRRERPVRSGGVPHGELDESEESVMQHGGLRRRGLSGELHPARGVAARLFDAAPDRVHEPRREQGERTDGFLSRPKRADGRHRAHAPRLSHSLASSPLGSLAT